MPAGPPPTTQHWTSSRYRNWTSGDSGDKFACGSDIGAVGVKVRCWNVARDGGRRDVLKQRFRLAHSGYNDIFAGAIRFQQDQA
jgi:hypothetical protein